MRFLYGFFAFMLWLLVLAAVDTSFSNEFVMATAAIVVAGAMAGGA